MADEEAEAGGEAPEEKKKGGMGPLIIGLVLALVLGGGSAFGVMSGMIPLPFGEEPKKDGEKAKKKEKEKEKPKEAVEPPVFVEFEPLTVTIGAYDTPRQLRMTFAIETTAKHQSEIKEKTPRILDALNTMLRAVDQRDLSEPYSLDRLRAQMARRVRVAVGPDRVRDVLIIQYFIL